MKTNAQIPFRFFGPVTSEYASDLADDMLNSREVAPIFERFLKGEIEPRELAYELQCLAETMHERRREGA